MFKVFIVEDEDEVRQGIRENINWESVDCTFIGEAPDGEMALPLIQELKPDILLSDIKMPFMDGLSLSRAVKKSLPWIEIILISGHDDFDLVQQAISIGVSEYILKPMDSEMIYKILKSIVGKLRDNAKKHQDEEILREKSRKSLPVLKERFLNELVQGILPAEDIQTNLKHFSIGLNGSFFQIEKLQINFINGMHKEQLHYDRLKVDTIIDEVISKEAGTIWFHSGSNKIIFINKGDSEQEVNENTYNLAQSVKHGMAELTNLQTTIGIGRTVKRLSKLYLSNSDAEQLINNRYIFGENEILDFGSNFINASPVSSLQKPDQEQFLNFLKFGDEKEIDEFLDKYLPDDAGISYPVYYLHYIFIDSMLHINEFQKLINLSDMNADKSKMEEMLLNANKVETIKSLLQREVREAIHHRKKQKENKYGKIISMAKEVIENNLTDEGLNLNMVADNVGLSPTHLSTVFSQETGLKFIEYLINKRIKLAQTMLKTTALRSAEIAYEVGYSDPQYFCYAFKKKTGFTPIAYRKEG